MPRLRTALFASIVALAGSGPAAGGVDRSSLALMPLPKAELGHEAGRLPLDPDSGVVSNADAAREATASVTAASLVRLGRITGYTLDYNDAAAAALRSGRGLLEVKTAVELYSSPAAAARGLAFWRRDDAAAAAFRTPGVTYSLDRFDPGRFGADRFAYDGTVDVRGKRPIYGVDLQFRTGVIVADVNVSSAEPGRARPLALAYAAMLERRIARVLAGRVAGPPVPVPGKAKAGPPKTGPALSTLALVPADLGTGRVLRQRYQLDPDLSPISEYEREMSPGGAFAYLDEEVALFHSPVEASYTLRFLSAAMGSRDLVLRFGGLAGSQVASFEPRTVTVHGGDEARAVIATVRLKDGRTLDEGFVILRLGSTTEFISVGTGVGGHLRPSAMVELASIAAARASRGLHRAPVA